MDVSLWRQPVRRLELGGALLALGRAAADSALGEVGLLEDLISVDSAPAGIFSEKTDHDRREDAGDG